MGKIGKRIIAIVMPIMLVAIVSLCLCMPLARNKQNNATIQTVNPMVESDAQIYYASAEDTGASTASSAYKGGAIFIEPNAQVNMKGGTLQNHSNSYGGAVFISSGATFTLDNGTITGCQATYGGGIYVSSGATCIINGGQIVGNSANYGPAIYVEKGGILQITDDTVVEDNEVYDENQSISISEDTVQVGGTYEGTASTLYLHYVEFGSYPQTYVGDSMNSTLESWYNSNNPANLKTYTTRENTSYNSGVYTSHMYTDGQIYARGYSYRRGSNTYSTGDSVPANGTVVWFKVEPIRWLVLNYEEYIAGTTAELELLSELVLTGYIYFNPSTSDGNSWSDSYIREWANGTFYNSAFAADEQEIIATSTVLNNVTGSYSSSTSDGRGTTTYDKIYLRSYYEMGSGLFSTGTSAQNYARRLCSPTDFALSDYAYMYVETSYTTANRPNGGTSDYWTRSAGGYDNYACLVGNHGKPERSTYVNHTILGVRPTLHLSLSSSES